jgi:hypothetical protein
VGRGFGLWKILYRENKLYGLASINGQDKMVVLSIWSISCFNIGKGEAGITGKGYVKDLNPKVQ